MPDMTTARIALLTQEMLPSLRIILKHVYGLKRCHTLDDTRRSARGPPELSNTDWGQNRAKIGISGKK